MEMEKVFALVKIPRRLDDDVNKIYKFREGEGGYNMKMSTRISLMVFYVSSYESHN